MSVREKVDALLKERYAYQRAEYPELLAPFHLKEVVEMIADEIDNRQLAFSGTIKRLRLKPTDIVVISMMNETEVERMHRVGTWMQEVLDEAGLKNNIAILAPGIQLSIVGE